MPIKRTIVAEADGTFSVRREIYMDTGELIDINTINYPTFDIALRAKQTEEEMVTKLYNAIMGLNGKGSKGE